MDEQLQLQIDNARQLLQTVRFAAMATVNEDGSPHNTPYFFMYDDTLTHLYWGSHPQSQHSKNVLRTGQLFVVLYDSIAYGPNGNRGGLYITAANGHITNGAEFDTALAIHNATRARVGKQPIAKEFYDTSEQEMWCADITKLDVYYQERDPANGLIIWEPRQQITADYLLQEQA